MIYYLFEYLKNYYYFPGIGLMQYISFRAGIALILSLWIALIYGKKMIRWIKAKQIEETIRELNLKGQGEKAGTPSMGGLIIIAASLIPSLLFTQVFNIYILMLIGTLLFMGLIGFIDDYIKIFKKNKKGLHMRVKLFSQCLLGAIIGATLYFNQNIAIKEKEEVIKESFTTKTTLPFIKNNEFDYAWILEVFNKGWGDYVWIIFIPIVILIICALSNGTNLTDGIDGLSVGTSSIVVATLSLFAWLSGNIILSNYLNIMYIPQVGEMVVFSAAFIGALIGFFWYNAYPAQIFMGDTGSLPIGGVIAVLALCTRKELMLPFLCGIFLIENLSVLLQVAYFKYTKKKYGKGKRIFLMAPIHHHFQLKGYHESKITSRFLIIQFMLAVMSIISLKIR